MELEQLMLSQGPVAALLVFLIRWLAKDLKKMHREVMERAEQFERAVERAVERIEAAAGSDVMRPQNSEQSAPAPGDESENYAGSPGAMGGIRKLLVVLALLCLPALAGCQGVPAQVHDDMQFGYQAWQEDKRPTLSDEEYASLDEQERELYIPAARERARQAFWEQALETSKYAAER